MFVRVLDGTNLQFLAVGQRTRLNRVVELSGKMRFILFDWLVEGTLPLCEALITLRYPHGGPSPLVCDIKQYQQKTLMLAIYLSDSYAHVGLSVLLEEEKKRGGALFFLLCLQNVHILSSQQRKPVTREVFQLLGIASTVIAAR